MIYKNVFDALKSFIENRIEGSSSLTVLPKQTFIQTRFLEKVLEDTNLPPYFNGKGSSAQCFRHITLLLMKKDHAQYKGLLSVLIEDHLFTLHFALLLWREGRNKTSAHLITRFYL